MGRAILANLRADQNRARAGRAIGAPVLVMFAPTRCNSGSAGRPPKNISFGFSYFYVYLCFLFSVFFLFLSNLFIFTFKI
jgi:hypothetical protein